MSGKRRTEVASGMVPGGLAPWLDGGLDHQQGAPSAPGGHRNGRPVAPAGDEKTAINSPAGQYVDPVTGERFESEEQALEFKRRVNSDNNLCPPYARSIFHILTRTLFPPLSMYDSLSGAYKNWPTGQGLGREGLLILPGTLLIGTGAAAWLIAARLTPDAASQGIYNALNSLEIWMVALFALAIMMFARGLGWGLASEYVQHAIGRDNLHSDEKRWLSNSASSCAIFGLFGLPPKTVGDIKAICRPEESSHSQAWSQGERPGSPSEEEHGSRAEDGAYGSLAPVSAWGSE